MANLNPQRFQYGLATLLGLMLATSLLLGAWRIGWWKVALAIALGTGALFCIAWVWFLVDELRR